MRDFKIIDVGSLIAGGATLLATFILFFRDTGEFMGSLAAAVMTAALVWGTYVVLRWLILANRN